MSFNSKTIQNLQYFVGKVCTVFTTPINRNFDELRSREHFVVDIQEITVDGIWGKHPYRKTFSFFPMEYVVLVQEEQVLDPTNPEHSQLIQEYEQKTGKKIVSDVSPHLTKKPTPVVEEQKKSESVEVSFVDIGKLASLAKETKRSYALHDIFKAQEEQKLREQEQLQVLKRP